jgi:hypothetical protein
MRALVVRVFTFVTLPLTVLAGRPAPACAQQPPVPRGFALAVQPEIPTNIEALLATPDVVLVTDYYRIDMRFGPSLRIDAVVVEAVDSRTRLRGLRVQVRDNENRSRQEGTSFLDINEIARLSRALTSMAQLAEKWTGQDDRQATELSFTSAGGFRLAIRQSARIPRAYLSTGLIDPVITSIEVAELVTLKQAFDQALAILNSK